MGFTVIPLFRAQERSRDWTQQELAEFYRVESALVQGGLCIESDRGMSDEGDPWFVFCRSDNGDPVVHFARVGGEYLIASPAYEGIARGSDFRSLVQNLIGRHKLLQTVNKPSPNVFFHPAALLIAIVGTAFFKVADAKASDGSDSSDGAGSSSSRKGFTFGPTVSSHSAASTDHPETDGVSVAINRNYALVVMAAALMAYDHDSSLDMQTSPQATTLFGMAAADLPQPVVRASAASNDADFTADFSKTTTSANSQVYGLELEKATSLVAVLKDLPSGPSIDHSPSVSAPAAVEQVQADLGASAKSPFLDDTGIPHSSAPSNMAVVHLVSAEGELPQVKAIKIISDLATAAHLEVSVPLTELPTALASVIERGMVVFEEGGASQFLLQHQDIFSAHSPNTTTESTNIAAPAIMEPIDPVASHILLVSGGVGQGTNASTDAVSEILMDYLHDNAGVRLIITKDSYVFVPGELLNQMPSDVESFTVRFNDGSSISLVGQHAALQHIFDAIA